jgi:hypothetical protein
MGGFGDKVLAVVGDPAVRGVCPEITLRFVDRTVVVQPGCWTVRGA